MNQHILELYDKYSAYACDQAAGALLTLADVITRAVPRINNRKDVLTVQEAAAHLNVTPTTVYALCKDGRLRHHRIGKGRGTVRIKRRDLENLTR